MSLRRVFVCPETIFAGFFCNILQNSTQTKILTGTKLAMLPNAYYNA